MKPVFLFILVVAMLLYSLPSFAADSTAGKEFFTKKCAGCHGAAGEGKEAMAKMMKVEMRHLGSKEVQAKTDAELRKIITEGAGKMKPPKDLDDKAVADLIVYLKTLAKK